METLAGGDWGFFLHLRGAFTSTPETSCVVLIGISWPFGRYGWLKCLLVVCSFGWGRSVMDDRECADVRLIEFVLSPLCIVIHLEIYFH